jgi:hypothetical protein
MRYAQLEEEHAVLQTKFDTTEEQLISERAAHKVASCVIHFLFSELQVEMGRSKQLETMLTARQGELASLQLLHSQLRVYILWNYHYEIVLHNHGYWYY